MNNILVATDFSNNAYNALFHITQLLKGKSCNFHLLNTYNEYTPLRKNSLGKSLILQLKEESMEGLQTVFHRIRLDHDDPKHNFNILSKEGELTEIISKEVKERQIDLVVMGNSGCSEVEAIFLGSNVLDAIGAIKKCPILTIPKEIDFKPPKQIAFVTDYGRSYDAGLLQPLLFIAKQYGSKICIMHINEEKVLDEQKKINRDVLLKYLSPFEHSMHWMPLFKSKATAIHTFLSELEIDMLAMVNYKHSFLGKMTREPVIKRMAFNLDIPFLVIPTSD